MKHLFTIYLENLSKLALDSKVGKKFIIDDKSIYQRLVRVLRLRVGEHFVLFDKNINLECILDQQTFDQNQTVYSTVSNINKNKKLVPEIIFCTALLKKNSFEQVIYVAAEMGATVVQPLFSEKVQIKWWTEKEKVRAQKIMISACEQAKNFELPEFQEPISLQAFLTKIDSEEESKKVVFDVEGAPLFDFLNELKHKPAEKIFLFFGPEGGFTEQELETFKLEKIEIYSLTPTILRAEQAVAVGLGLVRSIR